MPTASEDFYEILQVHPKAEPEVIKAAYQRLAQKYHPDKNPGQAERMGLYMKKLNEAYMVLGDPTKRAVYDSQVGAGQNRQSNPSTRREESHTKGPSKNNLYNSIAVNSCPMRLLRKSCTTYFLTGSKQNDQTGHGSKANSGNNGAGRQSSAGSDAKPPDIHGWTAEKVQAWQRETAKRLGLPVFFRHKLKTGGEGPVMAVIPPGSFLMGSPPDEPQRDGDEGPQHRVTFSKPFAVGRYAVSFAEYDKFWETTGRRRKILFMSTKKKLSDASWGRGQRPVINVYWDDAQAYCQWLSEQTGKNY